MKITIKVACMLFVGCFIQQIAQSQTTTNAMEMGGPPAGATSGDAVVVSNPPAASETSPAPATNAADNSAGMATTTNLTSVSMAATNDMSASTNETASATADTNVAPALPPIAMQDTPLTAAIEFLARQANLNYLLDPKINYGQPDQNGKIIPEPSISVRWENVTPQQALVALLDNYGLQMVENPKTKIYKVTTKDPTAPPPLITRVVQLKYASTSNMLEAVASAFIDKRSHVLPDTRTSQLVVVATESEQASIDSLITQLDKPTRQVLIETKIVELSSNPSTQKGIDWSGTLQAQNVTFGNNVLGGQSGRPYSQSFTPPIYSFTTNLAGLPGFGPYIATITPGVVTYGANNPVGSPGILADTAHGFNPTTGFLNADGVKAVISFLNASSDAQVVSTPRIVTLDNETATISVTRAFPVFNTTAGTQGSPGGSQLTYSNIGTVLEVTPRISANDYIWLKVIPNVSSFFGTITKTVGGLVNQADEFDIRSIDTQVLIPNSHTLVMGGLVKDNPNAQYTKVPFLGDIPVLGLAFRHENKSLEKDNLLLFITPTIVKEENFKPTATTFLDSEPRQMPDPMNPKTMYDGAQPHGDWSNPLTPNVK